MTVGTLKYSKLMTDSRSARWQRHTRFCLPSVILIDPVLPLLVPELFVWQLQTAVTAAVRGGLMGWAASMRPCCFWCLDCS